MRKFFLLVVCSMSFITLIGSAAFGAANGTDRPWQATGSGNGLFTAGTPLTFTIDGTSNDTHLGRSTFHLDGVCSNEDCSMFTFTFTIVAANGDTLNASGVNDSVTFTGGTGRFASASGTLTNTATVITDPSNPAAFHITFTQTGTISY